MARIPGLTERVLREARVSATIRSPHVTQVTDVDQLPNGVPYLVLELLKARRERKSVALDVAHDLLDPDLEDMASEAIHPDGRID